MPEQPSPHPSYHDQPPADPTQEVSVPIELTPEQEDDKKSLLEGLRYGYYREYEGNGSYLVTTRDLCDAFPLPYEVLNGPEVHDAIKKRLIDLLRGEDKEFDRCLLLISELLEVLPLPKEMLQDTIKEGLISLIRHNNYRSIPKLLNAFPLLYDFLNDSEVHNAEKENVIRLCKAGDYFSVHEILKILPLSQEMIQDAVKKGLIALLLEGQSFHACKLFEEFKIPCDEKLSIVLKYNNIPEKALMQEAFEKSEHPDPYVQHASDFYDDDSVPLAVRHSKEARDHVYNSVFDTTRDRAVDTAALSARITHGLSPDEYLKIAQAQPDAFAFDEKWKPNAERLVTELEKLLRAEGGDANIADMLRRGVDHFGADAMMRYMNRPDLSRHDALHFMPAVIQVQEASGFSPDQFSENILTQVARDGAVYNEGRSHQQFALIADSLKARPPAEILSAIAKYKNIEKLQTLVADLGSDPFGSWKNLKKLYEISQLLNRKEILEELDAGEVPLKIRSYIGKLAFHPNISTSAVMQFWKEPAVFLDVDDQHTPEEVNRVKKPTNLLSLPFLGLRAEDLRDALINGELDRVQVFPPMQVEYRFAEARKNLREEVRRALGSQKESVAGAARDIRKLFHQIKHEVFAKNQEKLTAFLEGRGELSTEGKT